MVCTTAGAVIPVATKAGPPADTKVSEVIEDTTVSAAGPAAAIEATASIIPPTNGNN
jgi:hypothetical protein